MGAKRLPMRKLREILRLKYERRMRHRAIARACGVGVGTVSEYVGRARRAGLSWPLPADLDDGTLEARLFAAPAPKRERIPPDGARIHQELKRAGVTLQLLWEEYLEIHPEGYRYSQFCEIYRRWAKKLKPSMRQVHRAGEKTFIDFSGKRPVHMVDPANRGGGRRRTVRRRTRGERLDLRRGHREPEAALLGRCPHPDGGVLWRLERDVDPGPTPKTGITSALPLRTRASNRTYQELAEPTTETVVHAGSSAQSPATRRRLEAAVLLAQRWILARLRDRCFFGHGRAEPRRSGKLLEELNNRPLQKLGVSTATSSSSAWISRHSNRVPDRALRAGRPGRTLPGQHRLPRRGRAPSPTTAYSYSAHPASEIEARYDGLRSSRSTTRASRIASHRRRYDRGQHFHRSRAHAGAPTELTPSGRPRGSSAGPSKTGPDTGRLVAEILQ